MKNTNEQGVPYSDIAGPDDSVETSLCEYGIAWADMGDKYVIYYGISRFDWDCDYNVFDDAEVDKNINLVEDFDFDKDDLKSFLSYLGMTLEEWSEIPLPHRISDLVSYWGHENLFGCPSCGSTYEEITGEQIKSPDRNS